MKKVAFVLLAVITFMSCEKAAPLPAYTIEGKWIWSPSEYRADANTMYEFVDGNIYTSYCINCPGDDDYWNSLDSTDRIPGVENYTFDGDTLVWDGTSKEVMFECDGGKLHMNGEFSHLWRLSSDCE
tara:strand:- start:87 stop:467 length:381 start_codon:yes stop_codon:yes gene_type:complete